jgi:hypothetical protein
VYNRLARKLNIITPRKGRSVNAKAVAQDVIAHIRQGKKVNMQVIQKAHGYSDYSAKTMNATKTKSYQEEMSTYLNSMAQLRDKTLKALHSKDLDSAKIFDLNLLLKNLNHDIQLLQGKSTENVAHSTNVVVFGSDDFLAMQMAKNKGIAQ